MNIKKKKAERGQSLVELAISLVLLLTLLVGAVEFGMAFFQFIQLRDAAQEGALYGSIYPYLDANGNGKFDSGEQNTINQAGIEARVRGASMSPVNLADTTIVTVVAASDTVNGKFCEGQNFGITVTVSYNHQIFMPILPQILGTSTLPLKASVTNTILSPVCP